MALNVLIVDDSATMRKIIMRSLRQTGIELGACTEAADGVEGLAALDGNRVDLILSDINMPNMNGLDFVKAVTERYSPAPPVVMITTEGSAEIVQEAMSRGAKGYLKKPFTPDKIEDTVNRLLGQ